MHLAVSKDGTSSSGPAVQETGLDGKLVDGSMSPPKTSTREKPQKVLPCPRCESMNTKFCYYNNYSVNQPRHFCRQCQRYWTVGGTLRNVPVGGGSRKKNRHQQRGEPYLIRTGPLAMAPTSSTTTSMAPPLPHNMTPGFNFPQLVDHHYLTSLSASKPPEFAAIQYGAMNPHTQTMMYPDLASLQLADAVKAEVWGNQAQVGANSTKSGGYDSSMLLHLGLNSRPQMNGKPWNSNHNNNNKNQETHHHHHQSRGGGHHAVNGTSPPHGSSTIEEEGSTPTNGYSNNGYEEGDTVSSMWQEMHDMQDIFQ